MSDESNEHEAVVSETTTTTPAVAPESATSGIAVAALVLGILAFLAGWLPVFGLLVSAAAVVLGIFAIRKRGGANMGFGITGIAAGGLGLLSSLFTTFMLISGILTGLSLYDQIDQTSNQSKEKYQTEADIVRDGKKEFTVGETAMVGSYTEMSVDEVLDNAVPSDSSNITEGRFVQVTVTLENIASTKNFPIAAISSGSFDLIDADGNVVSTPASDLGFENTFSRLSLKPGEYKTSNIIFEVPKDTTFTDVRYRYATTTGTSGDKQDYIYLLFAL